MNTQLTVYGFLKKEKKKKENTIIKIEQFIHRLVSLHYHILETTEIRIRWKIQALSYMWVKPPKPVIRLEYALTNTSEGFCREYIPLQRREIKNQIMMSVYLVLDL